MGMTVPRMQRKGLDVAGIYIETRLPADIGYGMVSPAARSYRYER
jgi:hypothetical protein